MLYKYFGPPRVTIFENFLIRFSQTCVLNDPFESAALISDRQIKAINDDAELLFKQILAEKGLVVGNDEEHQSIYKDALKQITDHTEKLTKPNNIGKLLIEMLDNSQGILSLSRTNSSLLMWAHYADSHRGFVIGLDETHPFFHAKDSQGKRTSPKNVIYSSRRMVVDSKSPDLSEQILCFKSLEWAYEEEVRVFRRFGENAKGALKSQKDELHLFYLPPECIREIYIGANASNSLKNCILNSVNRRKINAEIFEAYISEEKYEIAFKKLDGNPFNYTPKDFSSSTTLKPASILAGKNIPTYGPHSTIL